MGEQSQEGISTLEYHVLLALAGGALYGYAITDAVEDQSGGSLTPRAGTLYRILARLMDRELVCEVEPPEDEGEHPGRPRRWYALTSEGRQTLAEESRRLADVVALAEERLRVKHS